MLKHLSAAHPPPTYFVIVKIILLQLENTWSVISTFRCNISDQKYKAQVFTWIKKKREHNFLFFSKQKYKMGRSTVCKYIKNLICFHTLKTYSLLWPPLKYWGIAKKPQGSWGQFENHWSKRASLCFCSGKVVLVSTEWKIALHWSQDQDLNLG